VVSRRYANLREVELVRWLFSLGLNNCQISRITGVSVTSVAHWRRRPISWPRFRGRGAVPRCPRCHGRELDERTYAYLLGLYLGDGHIVAMRRGVYKLSIFQDERYSGILTECAEAMACVRSGERKPNHRHRDGAVQIYSYWKHWPCLFPQHGPGRKHERPIRLTLWQEDFVVRYPEALLRGLIHSDGCRVLNKVNGGVYPRYQFSNRSSDIRQIFSGACELYGVRWRQSNAVTISVSRRSDVQRLDLVIGPKR
jgi:hypothetical protein